MPDNEAPQQPTVPEIFDEIARQVFRLGQEVMGVSALAQLQKASTQYPDLITERGETLECLAAHIVNKCAKHMVEVLAPLDAQLEKAMAANRPRIVQPFLS